MSITMESNTSNEAGQSVREQLQTLCAHYLATDQWGRDLVMSTALNQSNKHPIQLPRQLRLVTHPGLDQQAHLIDDIIDRLPLALVR